MDNTKLGTNLASLGTDCISRQSAIDALRKMQTYKLFSGDDMLLIDQAGAQTELMLLPPIHPVIVRCKDCKHRYVDGDNIRYNACELNHNKVQSDEWFCADAEKREAAT